MPAHYTVVQCVPDPIADERINVGVIVYGDGRIDARFLEKWNRVAAFANEDISYVQEFAQRILSAAAETAVGAAQSSFAGLARERRLDEAMLGQMIGEWSNSIQFTEPQLSLQSADLLLPELAELFLREPVPRKKRMRDRNRAAAVAVQSVRQAFSERFGPSVADQWVRQAYQIAGATFDRNKLDVAVVNGRFHLAAQALSFEIQDMDELERQSRLSIFTLKDLRDRYGDLELGLVALPPRQDVPWFKKAMERYWDAERACGRVGAAVIPEGEAVAWAAEVANGVPMDDAISYA